MKRGEIRFHAESNTQYYILKITGDAVSLAILDESGKQIGTDEKRVGWMIRETRKVDASSKYNAIKTQVQTKGRTATLDSKLEADRYTELLALEESGEIRNLRRQVPYRLELPSPKTGLPILICKYVADFVYEEKGPRDSWAEVVEDPKGKDTELFKCKARLMLAIHGVEIRVTRRSSIGRYH